MVDGDERPGIGDRDFMAHMVLGSHTGILNGDQKALEHCVNGVFC